MFVHSTKYDGSLHYRYAATVVHEESGFLQLHRAPGTSVESYRGGGVGTRHSLECFWADRPYNLYILWDAAWQPRMHYINIATPATWHDGTLRFVDLDLDVVWRARSGEILLDDEDEFALHQTRFGYPAALIAQCWRASDDVRALITRREHPFDGSLYAWRPNGAM